MRGIALFALASSLAACGGDDASPASQGVDAPATDADAQADTVVDVDESGADVVIRDARVDAACEPGCHYDCFAVMQCVAGVVEQHGGGVVPCCHSTDPVPPGGACGHTSRYACLKGCGLAAVDARYATCLGVYDAITPPAHPEYEPLLCGEGAPKHEGDACDAEESCRPSATADRLTCSSSTKRCTVTPRPPSPSGYGGRCGLAPGDVPPSAWIATGKTCATCQVRADATCVLQACTTSCVFDEDCPTGSSCVCVPGGSICIATTDRTTDEGLTAWLACP